MSEERDYRFQKDIKYAPLELVDIPAVVSACEHPWFNQSLATVNDCVIRLGIVCGEFHWHHHDDEDEFFLVLSGRLLIDLLDRTVELAPHQGFMVPRGVRHRTRAPEKTVMLMMEKQGVDPVGDQRTHEPF